MYHVAIPTGRSSNYAEQQGLNIIVIAIRNNMIGQDSQIRFRALANPMRHQVTLHSNRPGGSVSILQVYQHAVPSALQQYALSYGLWASIHFTLASTDPGLSGLGRVYQCPGPW